MLGPVPSYGPPPNEVPGYAIAVASGLIRPIPTRPPTPLAGRSAKGLLRLLVLSAVVWFAAFACFVVVDLPAIVVLPVGGVSMAIFPVLGKRLGDRLLVELAHGYTTYAFATGNFWFTRSHGHHPNIAICWDFDGVWVLGKDGPRPPVAGAPIPPRPYPSPDKDGAWGLRTGVQWRRLYRDAPTHVQTQGA